MKNAIFRTSGLTDWIDAVAILSSRHGWEPVYWLDRPSMEAGVKNEFPEVTYHRTIDASRSIPPENYEEISFLPSPLDAKLLSRYLPYEKEVLRMMDRQDRGNVTGRHFTYDERIRHFHKQISYWNHVIETEDIELAIFAEVPHMIYDYLLYAACRENEIDTVMPMRTFLPGTNLLREKIHKSPAYLHNPNDDSKISNRSKRHLETLRSGYEEAKPSFMDERTIEYYLSKLAEPNNFPDYIGQFKNQLTPHVGRKHMKEGDNLIEESSVGILQQYTYYFRARLYKRKLARKYQELSEIPDMTKPYIYFPLHYQPERATAPEGGFFVDQYLAISLLAENLPADWVIYVKEHPHQFASHKKGEYGRRSYNYSDLIEIEEIRLVDVNVPTFDLIDRAKIVATITGTAGWEAIVRGIPALLFGIRWYRDCHGCFFTPTGDHVKNAIKRIENGFTIEERLIKAFINTVENHGYEFYLTEQERPERIGSEENAHKIAEALSSWYASSYEGKVAQ